MNPNHLNAYEVLKEEELQDIHSKGWLLRHKKTGARVMLIENSDENKVFNIAFRTPPKNSTGVAHILEHSVLLSLIHILSRSMVLQDRSLRKQSAEQKRQESISLQKLWRNVLTSLVQQ